MTRNKLLAVAVIAIPSWILMPLHNQIHLESVQARYGTSQVTRQMRDQLTQGAAIALLAGFRGVVADFVWIKASDYWVKQEWLRQYEAMQVTTTFQPLSTMFWDIAAWHMAWNIGYAVSVDPKNHTEVEGIKRQREWWDRAREYLKRGIENVPNRPDLYYFMGWLYWEKYKDACNAKKYFHLALTAKDEPLSLGVRMDSIQRLEARAIEQCDGPEAAYEAWKKMWFQDHEKTDNIWPVVEREIRRLEDELHVPDAKRVFPRTSISQHAK